MNFLNQVLILEIRFNRIKEKITEKQYPKVLFDININYSPVKVDK